MINDQRVDSHLSGNAEHTRKLNRKPALHRNAQAEWLCSASSIFRRLIAPLTQLHAQTKMQALKLALPWTCITASVRIQTVGCIVGDPSLGAERPSRSTYR